MTKDKKPDKNNGSKKGSVTCERTYVSGSRHQRRGAVRDKSVASLNRPRPAHQRADNAYVETLFVNSAVPPQLQGDPTASCSSTPYSVSYSCAASRIADSNNTGLPAVTFQGMRSSSEPPPRPGEGIIDEFPAYVPWKAEQRVPQDTLACNVCHKCRCAICQKLCKYPGMRVCGVLDVRSRCDEACVETTTVCVPCVQKTARCPASNLARAEANAVRAQAAVAAAAAAAAAARATVTDSAADTATADTNDTADANNTATAKPEDSDGEPRTAGASSDKCRLRWLLCCFCVPCPYCTVDDEVECSTGCRGNVNVSGCECVDWEALRQNNRRRVNAAAAAVAASRDRRRCRDYHYYISAAPNTANNPTAAAADKSAIANGESVGTVKKSRLRRFLRF
ncbi:unnamed protein product [Macrosiphum euphorbiae]|uniref:Uncharacterized protein n=1 Tax=Macrosiphum euphorbiae TaxID=13131 RepID=A0AAV0WJ29_9HEMI|nr:unnamed protein product [Macrosiphum euphorbiae]